ncbi:MAG: hypothetical protein KF856_13030 [Cyclobacteriaceae bacterium]|jgi:peptidoglycan hydrolase CwlO-like protein|nr:hypothetical protein [Cyclobacteriaceae bacterium]
MRRKTFGLITFCLLSIAAFSSQVDSTNLRKVNFSDDRTVSLEKAQVKIEAEIQRVDELNKTRFVDLYIWIGIFVALVTGGFVLITINANSTAKKQAIEELEKLKGTIDGLEAKTISIQAQLNEAQTTLQIFESLKKKENE